MSGGWPVSLPGGYLLPLRPNTKVLRAEPGLVEGQQALEPAPLSRLAPAHCAKNKIKSSETVL